ncbi:MAG: biopolymer transporter ExbD [Pseudomonadota bacterium]
MGFTTNTTLNVGRGQRSRKRNRVINDINITPLVDVMLVLLIIFMVTTPMMVSDIKVDLTKTESAAKPTPEKSVILTINSKGRIFINDKHVTLKELVKNVNQHTKGDRTQRIFLYGDRAINYGNVIEVFAQLNEAGFAKVALVTQSKKG